LARSNVDLASIWDPSWVDPVSTFPFPLPTVTYGSKCSSNTSNLKIDSFPSSLKRAFGVAFAIRDFASNDFAIVDFDVSPSADTRKTVRNSVAILAQFDFITHSHRSAFVVISTTQRGALEP
jgi:hypothetical protein